MAKPGFTADGAPNPPRVAQSLTRENACKFGPVGGG